MNEYTTTQAAEAIGNITADSIRKFAKKQLVLGADYKVFGRTIVITESGLEKIRNRNTKPGPKRD